MRVTPYRAANRYLAEQPLDDHSDEDAFDDAADGGLGGGEVELERIEAEVSETDASGSWSQSTPLVRSGW
jgi:hypothetical protein